ncbi:hypothetical protein BHE74_00019943 [Ensete ventricosum]|nr:hypothetical protein BHE74_00019943 [Ensete ventricosum]
MKKRDGYTLCAKSRVESSFDRFFVHHLGNSKYWPFLIVEFQSVFRAPSRKFKILAFHDVLAHGKSYEHGFMKKYDGQKLCAKCHSEWSFDWFFMHRFRNSKYWPSRRISPWEVSRVLISFSCTIPKVQNIGHSRCISP